MSAGPGTITEFHIVLALHVAVVIATFGVVFARPLVFAAANRQDRRSLPLLHRIEHTIERVLVAPGAVVVILTGVYLANWSGGRWDDFYVWWGICVVALIGAALAVVMIPTARRAEAVARRDLGEGAMGGADVPEGVGGESVANAPDGVGGESGANAPDGVGAGSSANATALSSEYRALARRLALVSGALCVLVLVTMLFMGLERPL